MQREGRIEPLLLYHIPLGRRKTKAFNRDVQEDEWGPAGINHVDTDGGWAV